MYIYYMYTHTPLHYFLYVTVFVKGAQGSKHIKDSVCSFVKIKVIYFL